MKLKKGPKSIGGPPGSQVALAEEDDRETIPRCMQIKNIIVSSAFTQPADVLSAVSRARVNAALHIPVQIVE